jgi:hypothetical protein
MSTAQPLHTTAPDRAIGTRRPLPDLATMRAELVTRLRPVCAEMSPDEFDRLVDSICRVKLRWGAEGP